MGTTKPQTDHGQLRGYSVPSVGPLDIVAGLIVLPAFIIGVLALVRWMAGDPTNQRADLPIGSPVPPTGPPLPMPPPNPDKRDDVSPGVIVLGYVAAVLVPVIGGVMGAVLLRRTDHAVGMIIVALVMVLLQIGLTVLIVTLTANSIDGLSMNTQFT